MVSKNESSKAGADTRYDFSPAKLVRDGVEAIPIALARRKCKIAKKQGMCQ
jgi:hypothetical protein